MGIVIFMIWLVFVVCVLWKRKTQQQIYRPPNYNANNFEMQDAIGCLEPDRRDDPENNEPVPADRMFNVPLNNM